MSRPVYTVLHMNRQILIILLLSVFTALLGIGIIVPVMPDFATRLGASGTSLGLMIAVFSLTRGFFQPIVGSLSDRWGRKGFLITALSGLSCPRPGRFPISSLFAPFTASALP